jgi:hypothetical protein
MRSWLRICVLVAIACIGCGRSDEPADTPTSQPNTPTTLAGTSAPRAIDPFYAEFHPIFGAADRTDGVPGHPATGSLLPTAPNIVRFVAYLADNGLELKYRSGYWWVVDPMSDKFSIQVSIRTFRADATPDEMRWGLSHFPLRYGLNTTARLAMSHPSLRRVPPYEYKSEPEPADLGKKLRASEEYKFVVARLKQLFLDYKP